MPVKLSDETLAAIQQQTPGAEAPPATTVPPTQAPAQTPTTPAQVPPGTTAPMELVLPDAGETLASLEAKIKAAGVVSPELKTKLATLVDPKYVDVYLARYNAELELAKVKGADTTHKVAEMNKYIFDAVKGEENFKTMAVYLKQHLPTEEINALNELLGSGDKAKVNLALSQAVTKFNQLKGKVALMEGDATVKAPVMEPLSKDEFQKICGSEKYMQDAAYRKVTDERRLRSIAAEKQRFLPGTYWTRDESGGIRRI